MVFIFSFFLVIWGNVVSVVSGSFSIGEFGVVLNYCCYYSRNWIYLLLSRDVEKYRRQNYYYYYYYYLQNWDFSNKLAIAEVGYQTNVALAKMIAAVVVVLKVCFFQQIHISGPS